MDPTSTIPCGTEGCDYTARWIMGPASTIPGAITVGATTYECPAGHFTRVETD